MKEVTIDIVFKESVPLSSLTTIGLGGPARFFYEAKTTEAAREALRIASMRSLPIFILGGGSNVVFADEGFDGLVLKTGMKGYSFFDATASDEVTVSVAAGENWDEFVHMCANNGLIGLESLSGIPGSCGAVAIQNVGAYGCEVSEFLTSVRVLDRERDDIREFRTEYLELGYRTSRFKKEDRDRFLVLDVSFRLKRNGKPEAKYADLILGLKKKKIDPENLPSGKTGALLVRETVLAIRKEKSMIYDPGDPDSISVGSFFMNPVLGSDEFAKLQEMLKDLYKKDVIPHYRTDTGSVKIPAAWLVEQSGFKKGYVKKGAGISSKHSLALINKGGSVADLKGLADEIQEGVLKFSGITLGIEPVFVDAKPGLKSRN